MPRIENSLRPENTPEQAEPELSLSQGTNDLLALAIPDAYTRLSERAGARGRERVRNGLRNRLGPYLEEISIIADQRDPLKTPAHADSTKQINDYRNGVKVSMTVCSDRRKGASAVALPQTDTIHRRPGGIPEFRESTASPDKKEYVMKDPVIAASIWYNAEKQERDGKKPKFYEKIVIHTDCAAGKKVACAKAADEGRPQPTGEELEMQSLESSFDDVREPMSGFDTDIKRAGGEGLTVLSVFDIYSQGEIYGLEYVYDEKKSRGEKLFDRNKSLRENFQEMEKNGKILRTEALDRKLLNDNPDLARIKQLIDANIISPLDIKSPENHAESMGQIGEVTIELTRRYEEKNNFTWIPEAMRKNIQDPDLLRSLAVDMIRNSVRRILADIEPGNHDRLKHPEELTRIGSTGGALNEQHPSFIISTPGGQLRQQDKDAARIIIPLQGHVADELGIDREKEAQVVIITEEYDADDYNPAKPELARKAYHEKTALVKYNAAEIRNLFPEEVADGRIVVVAALHDRSRRMTHVVSSLPREHAPETN